MPLAKAITPAVLRRLAGDGGFVRAEEYAHRKQVRLETGGDEAVSAQVTAANATYRVRLASEEGVLDYACDCPDGARGAFCEHCAAAGLSWLADRGRTTKAGKPVKPAKVTLTSAIKSFVAEDRAKIAEALAEWAKSDSKLADRLLVRAARHANVDTAAATVQLLFGKGFRTLYSQQRARPPHRFLKELGLLVEPVEELVKGSIPTAAVVAAVEACTDIVLDSPHHKDPTRAEGAITRLISAHFDACAHVRPDPAEVGRKIFRWELALRDHPLGLLPRYKEILGTRGAASYRKSAEEQWEIVSPPGRKNAGYHPLRAWMTHIMLGLAEYLDDMDLAISVRRQTADGYIDHLELAKLLERAGRDEEALATAERVVKQYPFYYGPPELVDFVLDKQRQLRNSATAAATAWQFFQTNPVPEQFMLLKTRIERLGFDWAAEAERAISEVAARIRSPYQDRSPLVEVLLASDQLERALREAESGTCGASTWLRIARKFAAARSPLAVDLHWKAAACAVQAQDYHLAVQVVGHAQAEMLEAGQSTEFNAKLREMRKTYSNRRNLRELLNDVFGTPT